MNAEIKKLEVNGDEKNGRKRRKSNERRRGKDIKRWLEIGEIIFRSQGIKDDERKRLGER